MKLFANRVVLTVAGNQQRLIMRTVPFLAALIALSLAGPGLGRAFAAGEDGVALAIIYDTSGSMKETVMDSDGKPSPKYVIANRALMAIAERVHAFATNRSSETPRKIQAGVWTFSGSGARQAVPFGPFDEAAIVQFARNFNVPTGNTPLGNALNAAAQAVLDSPLSRRHVLVITDGMNTSGPTPAQVLPKLKARAAEKETTLSVHFVAFDVDAKVFDPVKKLGATVVGASNEEQLKSQLQFILQRKILLEDEEPTKPKQ